MCCLSERGGVGREELFSLVKARWEGYWMGKLLTKISQRFRVVFVFVFAESPAGEPDG